MKGTASASALRALASLVAAFAACGDAASPPPISGIPTRDAAAPSTTVTASAAAPPTSMPALDAGPPDVASPPVLASQCFGGQTGQIKGPDYDQFKPVVGKKCAGTQHQTVTGVEQLVFLGDSVTAGTPPTPASQYYRALVTDEVKARFGSNVQVKDCSAWGAFARDYMSNANNVLNGNQVGRCFPTGVEQKKTLVIMTMGGNDISSWAEAKLSSQDAMVEADKAAAAQREAVTWLKDPAHFPNGSYVIFANVYEYTDTSGDLASCPTAVLGGFTGNWIQGAGVVVRFQELLMKIAVDTQSDMIFLLEHFCGHGYRRNDPALQCYRGPNTPLWFDLTCVHPTPEGHRKIADLFLDVIGP